MKFSLLLIPLLFLAACQMTPLPAEAPEPEQTPVASPRPSVPAPAMPPREDEPQATLPPQPLTPPGVEATPATPAQLPITEDIEQAAIRIAAKQLRVNADQVTLRGVKSVQWPDRSLGCPGPTDRALGGPTPGYLATVEVNGRVFFVHMDAQGRGLICLPESQP